MTSNLRWRRTLIGAAALLMLVLPSCTVHTPATAVDPPETLPETFSAGQPLTPVDRWWESFEEDALNRLVESALSENLTLRMAWARLDQARQQAVIAGAGKYPGLDFGFGVQQQNTGGSLVPGTPGSVGGFSASLNLSYQVDLWKKIENSRLAAVYDFEAGREDLQSTALTIASAVAELWASLEEQKALLLLLEEQLEVGRNYRKLVESRFGVGLSTAVDVYQQRQQVESILQQFPQAQMQQKLLKHQLALLLGMQPTAAVPLAGGALPLIRNLPPTGVPAEILRNRPDVYAAELRLLAADHRLAAAIADRYPSISLSAAAGGRSSEVAGIFNQWFTNLSANLLAPLFDAGRREAEAERNRAFVYERFYQWKSALLNAYSEVEDALVKEEGLLKSHSSTVKQIEMARQTLERSRTLYRNGITDYLTVLTSLQSLQRLQRAEISLRKSLVSNRIQLHLALGGSWTGGLTNPGHSQVFSRLYGGKEQ